jgi:hypothetical protein
MGYDMVRYGVLSKITDMLGREGREGRGEAVPPLIGGAAS